MAVKIFHEHCFFCGSGLVPLEMYYKVKWHQAKGCRWVDIGKACETCGESRMTRIESQKRPLPEVAKQ